ncbi:hypothetical protein [Candidatus Avelusimicrobium alvi]|uniref:hypothetical protein n=1 Tax=Candidatus Avelusimicrobium alvi TaxID=3416221 RepID=UPI003D13AABC
MNLFKFLKSVSGKVVLGTTQVLGTSAAVGLFATYTMFNTASNQVDNELAVRSLSSVASSTSAYEGLQRRNGLLTSINVKDGLNQVATAEERAALEAGGSSTNFGLDNVERVQNVSFGSAAQTSETDGLGMGGNKAVFSGPIGSGAAGGSAPGVHPGAVAGAVGSASSGAAGGERPTLGTASMARASGNAFNAAAGSVGGGSAASGARGASSRASGGSSGSGDGYQLSGAMPSGTNAVSSLGLSRGGAADGSTFMAGGRHSTTGRVTRSFREKNDLKDISKRSADAAGNRNRAANEGSRAFLASARNSGGMTVEGGVEVGETGSADFKSPEASQLKSVGNWADQEDDYQARKDKARKALAWKFLFTLANGVAMMYAAAAVLTKIKLTWLKWALAGVFMLWTAITCFSLMKDAIAYQAEFGGVLLSTISCLASLAIIGGMTFVCLKPEAAWTFLTTKLLKKLLGFASTIALGFLSSTILSNL